MRRTWNWPAGILAGGWLLVVMIPVYMMVRAAFSSREDYQATGPLGPPNPFTLENFQYSFENGFGKYLVNSGIVTLGTIAMVLLVVPPLAYVTVRGQSRWVRLVFKTMLFGLAIPAQVVVIPLYFIIVQAGLFDTLIGVILPSAAFLIPLTTLILSSAMREISNELYEAMALDGAGSFRTFIRLVLPLSGGGIATIVVFSALQAWNNYLLPLTLTRSDDVRLATLGLGIFKQEYSLNIPGLMSAIVLTVIPILLIYIFARRSLVRGLMGVGGK
ncbi:carbohydrate ABC transporter permease [Agromyces sp. SYSU T0242]|uniref:carbohydrate ABC transporter permease n=1 Tax=Agromyces litoreus TaxID=3158561 RepID=UPI00339455C6